MLIESVNFAMDSGVFSMKPLEQRLADLESIDEFRIVPAAGFSRAAEITSDRAEQAALESGDSTFVQSVSVLDGHPVVRLTRPILAKPSCLLCHPQFSEDDPLAAVTVVLSTTESADALSRFVITVILIAVVTTAVLVVALGLIMGRIVRSPIASLRDLVRNVAEGDADLTKRLSMKRIDEIGEASRWVDVFLDLMHSIVKGIKESSSTNTEISNNLDVSVEQNLKSSKNIRADISRIEDQLERVTRKNQSTAGSVEEILGTITKLNDHIGNQSSSVTQASAAIEEMTSSIASVASVTGNNSRIVAQLLKLTQDGDDKVRTTNGRINEISDRQ